MEKSTDIYTRLLPPENFDGPTKSRKCTDLFWCLILLICWVCMGFIGFLAMRTGDINVVTQPVDYKGRFCGVGSMESSPNLYFLRADGTGVCVPNCPSTTNTSALFACVDDSDIPFYLEGSTDVDALVNGMFGFCMFQLETINARHYCVVSDPTWKSYFPTSAGILATSGTALNNIWVCRDYIIGFGLSAALVFYLYVVWLNCGKTVKILVWSGVVMVFVALVLIGTQFLVTGHAHAVAYSQADPNSSIRAHDDAKISYAAGSVAIIFATMWLCWTITLRAKIQLASDLIQESARAVSSMPSLLILPVFQVITWCGFFALWALFVLYITTSGHFEEVRLGNDPLPRSEFIFDSSDGPELGFLTFVLIWTSLFITGFTDLVISHSTSLWYFARQKKRMGCCLATQSLFTILFHHFGTAAIGSLLITAVYPFRAALTWIDKQMRKCCAHCNQAIYCCFCCCLFMAQHFFRFWTKYAYAFTALFSQDFLTAGKTSFFLLERNIFRVSAITVVCEYIMLMLVLLVTFTSTVISYYVIKSKLGTELDDLVVPTVTTFALALLVSVLCVEVLGMTTRTLLICFFADCEMFKPDDRYAQHSLHNYMESAKAEKGAEEEKLNRSSPKKTKYGAAGR